MYISSGLLAYTSTKHKVRFTGPLKFMRFIMILMSGPFYMPFLGWLAFTAVDCDSYFDSLDCSSALFWVRAVGTFFAALLYIL
ncbi:hypothetical protein HK100_006787 [Physocladia obscura]|uniref:Uncharacterized protein n=1 Tax=Physocladia obscura TaxID=109957 RepID=A0AAD5SS66_9FUNG|nr:hypothetical protein HK100_006787 [Physocladia obscura]